MKTTFKKDKRTNKVTFYQNGNKVYPIRFSGNIYEFKNGDLISI